MGVFDKITKRKPAVKKEGSAEKPAKKTVKKAEKAPKETKIKKGVEVSKKTLDIIIGPVVSEKAAQLAQQNVVVFKVRKDANRVAVRNAVRELYKVTPVRVNIVSVRGKWVRFGRFQGRQGDHKKALVYLPKGTSLDIFEGV